jgi:hypothetical protein
MSDGAESRGHIEQIAHERGIYKDILCFGLLAHPRGDENVTWAYNRKRVTKAARIAEVSRDVLQAGHVSHRAPR